MDTTDKKGGCKIALLLPFVFEGKRIQHVHFAAVRWKHLLGWKEGKYPRSMDLLIELTGLSENALRELAYPDVDRIMAKFVEIMPPEVRSDFAAGINPAQTFEPPPVQEIDHEPPSALDQEETMIADQQDALAAATAEAEAATPFKPEEWTDFKPADAGLVRRSKTPEDSGIGFDLGEPAR